MTLPCANESRIAVMENTLDRLEKVLSENTNAFNNLSVVLAKMEGSQRTGSWVFGLLSPMIGGGFISLIVVLLTK